MEKVDNEDEYLGIQLREEHFIYTQLQYLNILIFLVTIQYLGIRTDDIRCLSHN